MKQKGKSTNWTWKKMTETIHRRKERSKDRQKWKWTTKFITMKKPIIWRRELVHEDQELWWLLFSYSFNIALISQIPSRRRNYMQEREGKENLKEGTLERLKRN
jgi:hypothetical protein